MKELGITKGEWWACCKDTRPHFIFVGEGELAICGIRSNDPAEGEDLYEPLEGIVTMAERIANAALIADAGNTAQKCGLLPSELLKQRDESRYVLKKVFHSISENELSHSERMVLLKDIESAIKSTESHD